MNTIIINYNIHNYFMWQLGDIDMGLDHSIQHDDMAISDTTGP